MLNLEDVLNDISELDLSNANNNIQVMDNIPSDRTRLTMIAYDELS